MAKVSIIERIAAERKKKKMQRKKTRRKNRTQHELDTKELENLRAKLEVKLASNSKASDEKDLSSDQMLLEAIKKELEQKRIKSEPRISEQLPIKGIRSLVENGTKKEWTEFIAISLKNKIKMEFPPLEAEKCKFNDYGYRQFIELIITSENMLRLLTKTKDVSGFYMVELHNLLRGDEPTLRGIEALCSLLINRENRYDPVCETDFKYLNIILDSFTVPKKDGINKAWEISADSKNIKVTASFEKDNRQWIYTISTQDGNEA